MNNTLDNAFVRFFSDGTEAYPTSVGAGTILGLFGAILVFNDVVYKSNQVNNKDITAYRTAEPTSKHHHSDTLNQVEGGAIVLGGPLLSMMVVSAAAASFVRGRRAIAKLRVGSAVEQPVEQPVKP